MKIKIDKIIALLGSALLGYYLGLSIFSGPIWRLLTWTLPPINNRHLPMSYTAIMGALIGISLGYLIYIRFIEKYPVGEYKKQYASGIAALLLLPLITMVAFRIQSVNYVREAEATDPTEINLRFENPRVSFIITEDHRSSSSTSFGKAIRLLNEEALLKNFGAALRSLELVEASEQGETIFNDRQGTIWITYRPDGNWYSKILSWWDDGFEESVANQQRAFYKGPELEKVLKGIDTQLGNVNSFTSAEVLHTSFIDGDSNQVNSVPLQDFQFLLDHIHENNIITPDYQVVANFEGILNENGMIRKEDINYYAFALRNHAPDTNSFEEAILLENVILYDDILKVAWFEGNYYSVDLSPIL